MSVAEHIYSASASEEPSEIRLAERLARDIEDEIASGIACTNGVSIGSIRELSERHKAGRAAVREALALLERRGLGTLRPGPCGGFVLKNPDPQLIASRLADYFRMTGLRLSQLADARRAVDLTNAALTAQARPDKTALESFMPHADDSSFLDWYLRLCIELARQSGELVNLLFVQCLNELTGEFAIDRVDSDDWRDSANVTAEQLQAATSAGDGEGAVAILKQLDAEILLHMPHGSTALGLPTIETARMADDRTLATLVARKLAAEILQEGSSGKRLGSEWELCERLSVSRATLRQAVRQLQDSGLVECRRGRGNGLIVRELRRTGSIRLVLSFLIGSEMNPRDAGTIMFYLNRSVPALAVTRANAAERAELEEALTRATQTDPVERIDLLQLVQCVSRLADSPVIDLFSRCLAAYEARFHPFLAKQLPLSFQTDYFELLRQLLDEPQPFNDERVEWAKQQSARVMMDMARKRPI